MNSHEVFRYIKAKYNFTKEELRAKNRHSDISLARHITCWLLKNKCDLSYPQAGLIIHRDHSSVFNSCMAVDALVIKGKLDIKGDLLSTTVVIERIQTVDKSLKQAMDFWQDRFREAFKIDPFFMMSESNKIAEKVLNRKD